ncbi:MAG: hypothetical protein WAV21_02255 [Minisyncoccia bacterium]
MPDRFVSLLGATFAGVVTLYVSLVVVTICFASIQTDLAGSIHDTEASIGSLESEYYQAIAALNEMDPATLGFSMPTKKLYAVSAPVPALSRADF